MHATSVLQSCDSDSTILWWRWAQGLNLANGKRNQDREYLLIKDRPKTYLLLIILIACNTNGLHGKGEPNQTSILLGAVKVTAIHLQTFMSIYQNDADAETWATTVMRLEYLMPVMDAKRIWQE